VSNYEEEKFELRTIYKRSINIVRMNQPNIDEYVLTFLSCFYPWLFIPSYFWFLRALYYDSRPILGQSCSRSNIFIAAAISRDTWIHIGNILFFWRKEGASSEFFIYWWIFQIIV